ncbi:MAG: aminopeptidase [Phycisphaerae bacterium]|nr:aminopeptidase [Phycisphaerae bacterium]MCZ2399574.1 aminopeptidase [Phycisphaerae bacterium]NUQ49047.1 aminopeptidase [Phycisphaerae bacterium]
MHDSRLDRLAHVLVRYSTAVRKDDLVLITGPTGAAGLATAVYAQVLAAGGHPWVRLYPEDCSEVLLKQGSTAQLGFCHPFETHVVAKTNVRIVFWASENTKSLSNVDPGRQALVSKGRKPLLDLFMKRAGLPKSNPDRLRWVGTAVPTQAAAQDAEMSLREYADFVFGAGKLDEKDPIAAWKKSSRAQARLCDFLDKAREMHITAPGGTDIRFGIRGRRWINCDGHENFPDGEVFTAPIEDATEGTVVYDVPSVFGGREVENVRLTFRAGKVVEASAGKNEAFLVKMLDQDPGARILGELAIGTNYSIQKGTRNTLFDEKIGGTFHAALGAAYPESGGRNKSGLHWDMVCDLRRGGRIMVDGEVISERGRFKRADWPR